MNEPRDTLVGDALRRLDVAHHAPDFWARLDAGLREGSAAGGDESLESDEPADADVVELDAVRRSASARSSRWPAAAAAAAVAAIALAVGIPAAQQAADGDAQVDITDTPDQATLPVPDPAPPTTPTTEPVAPPAAQRPPIEVATEWLGLVRDGEFELAYAMLDANSQQSLALDTFRELSASLAEGAGAFADLEPTSIELIDDEGLAATAVVFTGDVQREGFVETASYPVVVTGDPADTARPPGIAFVLDGPTVEAVQSTQPSETRTSQLELELSPTAGATWAIVDGVTLDRIDSGEARVTFDVEAGAGPGTHTVVIISTEAGLYTARSFTVVVP